jgi:hypothetical protein
MEQRNAGSKSSPGFTAEPSGAPRLLNAAAWLERLAALEAEFKTALSQDAAAREQNLERRRGEVTPR